MRILAVDDDPIILELLVQFMDAIGDHELTTALSGSEALDLARSSSSGPFDCILCDIQMPEMDGVELTKAIRAITQHQRTPIVMLTAMTDKQYVDAAFAAGATDYVTKPFEVMELKARLNSIEVLVQKRTSRTNKIFAAQAISGFGQSGIATESVELNDVISIYDVDNVIDFIAMENYMLQLSRGALFGSTTFAFTIRKIDDHHQHLSSFAFSGLISDVAEVISDVLADHQFLMCYAGSGTFVGVTESGWRPNLTALMDAVNLTLSKAELYDDSGQQLYVRVSVGKAVRLIWRTQDSVMDAISEAHASAESASISHERSLKNFWPTQQYV